VPVDIVEQVMTLRDNGMDPPEIARVLGISVDEVLAAVVDALRRGDPRLAWVADARQPTAPSPAPTAAAFDEAVARPDMSDGVRRVPDDEIDGVEGWIRWPDEHEVRGVEAMLLDPDDEWPWTVTVSAFEFVREEPIESEAREAVVAAIRSVSGVTAAAEEDREVWVVQGKPSGQELCRAVAEAVDRLAPRIREHIRHLGYG